MAMSKADRRRARSERATKAFGRHADAVLDGLALLDYAWHGCYGEHSPPEQVVEDIFEVSGGDLAQFVAATHLAVVDFRDLRVWAEEQREGD